jgi:hypothetical protein
VIIRLAHPRLVSRALQKRPGLRNLFWYRSEMELKLLYSDYVNLCSRTGFQPPRLLVERNIAELAKRILSRQHELVGLVQKRWRGVMTRRIIKLFSQETIRLREWRVSFLMRIQRAYRGHCVRLVTLSTVKVKSWTERMRREYLEERSRGRREKELKRERDRVQALYQKERRDEFSCRVLNRIEDTEDSPRHLLLASASSESLFAGGGAVGGGGERGGPVDQQDEGSPNRWYRNEYTVDEEDDEEGLPFPRSGRPSHGGHGEGAHLSSRSLSSLNTSASGGVAVREKKKMLLFSQSCYSSDDFKDTLHQYLGKEASLMRSESDQRASRKERKGHLLNRIAEHGPRGYGQRGYAHSQKGVHALPDHLNHKIFLRSTPKTTPLLPPGGTRRRGSAGVLKKAIASVEPQEFRLKASTRSRGMNSYHLKELSDIINEEVLRSTHQFLKPDLKEKIALFQQQTAAPPPSHPPPKGGGRLRGSKSGSILSTATSTVSTTGGRQQGAKYKYKYPANVNEDPLRWLSDDIDTTIRYQDQQKLLQRAASKVS